MEVERALDVTAVLYIGLFDSFHVNLGEGRCFNRGGAWNTARGLKAYCVLLQPRALAACGWLSNYGPFFGSLV